MQIESDWCIEESTTPWYIDSNAAQKFEVGQNLNVRFGKFISNFLADYQPSNYF
jgi:hypothetical protein